MTDGVGTVAAPVSGGDGLRRATSRLGARINGLSYLPKWIVLGSWWGSSPGWERWSSTSC